MKTLKKYDYDELIKNGKVLTKDKFGDKVIKLSNGNIAKMFRLKRFFSSALIWPYFKRFNRAVTILTNRNIPTVDIIDLFKVPSINRDLIVYKPLEGKSLRELINNKQDANQLVLNFASFFAHLHNEGIYFRAIHFNNVIVTPQGKFGLIDLADCHCSSSSLNRFKRIRNFKPILNYKEDIEAIASVSMELFLDKYIESTQFGSQKDVFKFKQKVLIKWAEI